MFCFFTLQLKANEPLKVSKTVRQGAIQEAMELIVKDLTGEPVLKLNLGLNLDLKLNPLPPFKASATPAKPDTETPQSETKSRPGKRKSPAPIVSPSKFRFGISDKEI
ncbi:MAG: hypothetical protein CMJ76_04190 [Planctomycetaceae bacterium]|nr:hypothetical protein [Planctomycetaceae bacterium]